jgi:predicted RNase H-like HicB family nuclease
LQLPIAKHENVAKQFIREKVLETYRLVNPIPTTDDWRYINGSRIVDDIYRVYTVAKNPNAALSLLTTFEDLNKSYTIRVQEEPEGGYSGQCVELPGAISEGETLEELRDNMREAIELVIEYLKEKGLMDG